MPLAGLWLLFCRRPTRPRPPAADQSARGRIIRPGAAVHQLGQHYCPMPNMANSGRQNKKQKVQTIARLDPARCPATLDVSSGPRDLRERNGGSLARAE